MEDLLQKAKTLPDSPGVYLFYSKDNELVYVGRATSLKSRVSSYFRGKKTPRPIEEMIHEVVKISHETTESVLESVIREAHYIKQFQPKYNVLGKDSKSWNYIIITKDVFPKIQTIREHELISWKKEGIDLDKKYFKIFGPYPGLNMKAAQKILRRLFRYSTCEPNQKRPCLYYEMGQCLGVCAGTISASDYKKQVINPLVMFLSGKKKTVIKDFEKQMKAKAKAEQFEDASRLRDQIHSLQHIHDITIIDKSWFEYEQFKVDKSVRRIEGYDISNLGTTGMVGSMVVFQNGEPKKSDYRKFNIKTVAGQSDVDCLAEVINRRLNHEEWPRPEVILLDGGRPQINRIKKVFKERKVEIPFLGIAKGAERKRNDIILGSVDPVFIRWASEHRGLLIRVRDEAHRFAITFQRSKRKIV
ncbi:MAG: GIY-YIG nuclease family protein [Patescibacteria group bacterium]|jgi:excinuclease ABC subunit C